MLNNMANYYISDLHHGHLNCLSFDSRPFKTLDEMHETILNNINSKCKRSDHLYLLGDILWRVNDDSIAWVSKINPSMHLVVGNHERIDDSRYKRLFVEICDYKEVTDNIKGKNYGVVLSHYPIMFWNKMRQFNNDGSLKTKNYNILLYGHTHNTQEEQLYQQFLKYVNDNYGYGSMAFNVGCMHWNYTPVTLEEILNARVWNVDGDNKDSNN